jgi:hypothetical protein
MAKKKGKTQEWLIMPEPHSEYNDDRVEQALLEKFRELLGAADEESLSYMFLSGNFYDTFGYTYSAIRDWRGAIAPGGKGGSRRPMLDATFASLSVYLSSLVSFQVDFYFAFKEIEQILQDQGREDLWTIIEEKLPFVSLPPAEMFPKGLHSPISPYYTIQQDADLALGELYSTVFLSEIVTNFKSRFFAFFSWQGYTAFGYFNVLPVSAKFGFNEDARDFDYSQGLTSESVLAYVEDARNIKECFIGLMQAHNGGLLKQYLIPDYENLLNRLLQIEDDEDGEGPQ